MEIEQAAALSADAAHEFDSIDAELAALESQFERNETLSADEADQLLHRIKRYETHIFHALNRVGKAIDRHIPAQDPPECPRWRGETEVATNAVDRAVLWQHVRDAPKFAALKRLEPFNSLPNGAIGSLDSAHQRYIELNDLLTGPPEAALQWASTGISDSTPPKELLGLLLRLALPPQQPVDVQIAWLRSQVANLPPQELGSGPRELAVRLLSGRPASEDIFGDQTRASELLKREFCSRHSLPLDDALLVAAQVAQRALPQLARAQRIKLAPRAPEDPRENEMLVEVDLPARLRFHPVFVCPVTKSHSASHNGRSLLLPCKHILSETAVQSLPVREGVRIRCPYCPRHALLTDLREVEFI